MLNCSVCPDLSSYLCCFLSDLGREVRPVSYMVLSLFTLNYVPSITRMYLYRVACLFCCLASWYFWCRILRLFRILLGNCTLMQKSLCRRSLELFLTSSRSLKRKTNLHRIGRGWDFFEPILCACSKRIDRLSLIDGSSVFRKSCSPCSVLSLSLSSYLNHSAHFVVE